MAILVTASSLITHLRRYIGVPYLFGGKTSKALDCSGLIALAMRDVGLRIPQGSTAQIEACERISVEDAWATPGAMLWREGHNAISLGDGTAIEAIRPKVSITKRTETYQGQPRFTRGGLLPHIDYLEANLVRMSSPIQGRVSSQYGYRNLGGSRSLHAGIDIAAAEGSTVHAAFAGVVERVVSGRKRGQSAATGTVLAPGRSGNGVIIRNPDGERQLYGHVSPRVKVGASVRIGDVLGKIDLSGITTGPHLHFEVWGNHAHTSHRDPMIDFKHFGVTPGAAPVTTTPSPAPSPAPVKPVRDQAVLRRQQDLNKYAAAGLIEDGVAGPVMQAWDQWVGDAQRALNAFRSSKPKLKIDQHYGKVTADYVTDVQKRNHLHPDGVLGPVMIRWMRTQGSPVPNRPKNRP